jgi:ribosome recycling factor
MKGLHMASIENLLDDTEEKMMNAIAALERAFGGFRTGKASPALVENVMVEHYGSTMRLRDIAGVSTPEPRLLVVQPWDPGALPAIEKGITAANIGISPVNDGRVIRLPVPELSEERRKELGKEIRKRAEECKVELRNHRRDANELAKNAHKNHELPDDHYHDRLEDIQKLTDRYAKVAQDLADKKEAEIMQV